MADMRDLARDAGHRETTSDRELLDRFIAECDQAAFACLVERYRRIVWSMCRRVMPSEHDAEDAYQAAFVVLAQKASSIRRGEAIGSWLYRVAYRIALKARQRLQRRQVHEQRASAAEVSRESSPAHEAAVREMQTILDEEVERLRERERQPFVLCCLEGMSRAEAARELGWPEETLKARLAQARQMLRTRLARRGISLSAVLTATALAPSGAMAAPAVLVGTAAEGSLSHAALALAKHFVHDVVAKSLTAFALLLGLGFSIAAVALSMVQPTFHAQAPVAVGPAAGNPERFVAPPTSLIRPHDEQILAVALSPDGKRLVTAGARHTLPGQFMIWDVAARKELVRLRGMRGIRGIAFAPDGKTVACGSFGATVELRDVETGQERAVLTGHRGGVNAVAFSADGRRIASAGLDALVKLWDVATATEVRSFAGHSDMVFAIALFRDGKRMLSGSKDRTARIWDLETGEVVHRLRCPQAVEAVAVSPDDRTVVTGSWDRTIRLWDAATGQELAALASPEGLILGLAFSADGAFLASSSSDGSTRLWDVAARKTIRRFEGHTGPAWSVAFTSDRKILATGSTDTTARLWDVETAREIGTLLTAQQKPVSVLAYAPDGKTFAVTGSDGTVQVRDALSGEVRRTLIGHADRVTCIAFAPDGATLASGSRDTTVKLWDLATGEERRSLDGHAGGVQSIAFSPDGRLASAGMDRLVKLWDLAGGAAPTILSGHDQPVHALAFATDGATLASGGGDGVIRIWARGQDAPQRVLPVHSSAVRALAFAPNGLLACLGEDGALKLWGPGADQARPLLGQVARAMAFTLGGTLVTGGADGKTFVWDLASGTPSARLTGHLAPVTAVAVHPQGEDIITGSEDATLLRWRRAGPADTTPKIELPIAAPPASPAPPAGSAAPNASNPTLVAADSRERAADTKPGGRLWLAVVAALLVTVGLLVALAIRRRSTIRMGRGPARTTAPEPPRPALVSIVAGFAITAGPAVALGGLYGVIAQTPWLGSAEGPHLPGAYLPGTLAVAWLATVTGILWLGVPALRAPGRPRLLLLAVPCLGLMLLGVLALPKAAPQDAMIFDFRDGRFDAGRLETLGADGIGEVRPTPDGLEIAIPAKAQGAKPVGFAFPMSLEGDFEVTLRFEVVQAVRPTQGKAATFSMWLPLASARKEALAIGWSGDRQEGGVFTTYHAFDDGVKRQQELRSHPVPASAGGLRLQRQGRTLRFLAATGTSQSWSELRTEPIGDEDVRTVRVAIQSRGAPEAFAVRVTELRVKTGPSARTIPP